MSRGWSRKCESHLRALTTEATGELDILALDGDTLGMNSAKVSVLKEGDEVGLDGFLEGTDGRRLEAEIGLEVLSNLTNETLKWQLSDQKLGGLLVTTDLTESDGSWLVSVGLLDTSRRWCGFTGSLRSKLLTRSLASSRLAGSLLGTSHCINLYRCC